MPSPENTKFQDLHLQRLANEFGIDIGPAAALFGPELDAWLRQVEDELLERLLAERREVSAQGTMGFGGSREQAKSLSVLMKPEW